MCAMAKRNQQMVNFGVSPEQFAELGRLYGHSACQSLSEYIRKVVLQKPVFVKTHNQYAAECLATMNEVKNELHDVVKNYSPHDEKSRQTLLDKVEEIRVRMKEIYESWSPM